jgi:plasmid stabilization system protein ParE
MTAMPEAKLAREAELPYALVAMVTDYDCWRAGTEAVTVTNVLEVMHANAARARDLVRHLVAGAKRIPAHPRLGMRLPEFAPREVRRILIGDYEIRYEIAERDVIVVRIFHTREDR